MAAKKRGVLFGIIVGLVALVPLSVAAAVVVYSSLETESGTKTANAAQVSDTSASGGSAVAFSDSAATCDGVLNGGTCYPSPPATAANGKSWQLTFNEEFSGSSLNTNKLTPCFDWNYGGCHESFNHGRERYIPSQVQVSGGTAKLVGEPLSPAYSSTGCYQGSCTYKSGLVSTARPNAGDGSDYLYKFTYGYVEGRLKLPPTQGFFTAFWMLPADPTYSYDYEIDMLEFLAGDNTTAFMTYHYNDRTQSYNVNSGVGNNGACAAQNFTTGFNRFGMDWQADHVAFYINGVKCGQFNGSTANIPSSDMQIILNLMIDVDWQRAWNLTLQNQSAVDQLEADYIRVYQQL